MKLHTFVSGSALVLAGWLAVTFFHDLSPQQYPKQRRGTLPAQSLSTPAATPATALAAARPLR